jgi:hypothetical protein
MKLLCEWCRVEGKAGYLQLLSHLPSRSFPDVVLLIVARRNDAALYERLRVSFAGTPQVKVILDRRWAERRAVQRPVAEERRRMRTRRIRQGTVSSSGGYTVVRFSPKMTTTMSATERQH